MLLIRARNLSCRSTSRKSPEFLHLAVRAFRMRRLYLCFAAALSVALLGGAGQPVPHRLNRAYIDQEKADLAKTSPYPKPTPTPNPPFPPPDPTARPAH